MNQMTHKSSSDKDKKVSEIDYELRWDYILGKDDPKHGDLRINSQGEMEEFHEGYWMKIENRK